MRLDVARRLLCCLVLLFPLLPVANGAAVGQFLSAVPATLLAGERPAWLDVVFVPRVTLPPSATLTLSAQSPTATSGVLAVFANAANASLSLQTCTVGVTYVAANRLQLIFDSKCTFPAQAPVALTIPGGFLAAHPPAGTAVQLRLRLDGEPDDQPVAIPYTTEAPRCGTRLVSIGQFVLSGSYTLAYNTTGLACTSPCGVGCLFFADSNPSLDDLLRVAVQLGRLVLYRDDLAGATDPRALLITCYYTLGCPGFGSGSPTVAFVAGDDYHGGLGLGLAQTPNAFVASPTLVGPPSSAPVTSFAMGISVYAFVAGGALWAGGRNVYGSGYSDGLLQATPARVAPANGQAVTEAACGANHLGYLAGGDLFITGQNTFSQAGVPYTAVSSLAYYRQVRLPFSGIVTAVFFGGTHSAFAMGQRVFVFGTSTAATVASAVDAYVPTELFAPDNRTIQALAFGSAHALMLAGGWVYGIGSTDEGQLGEWVANATATFILLSWRPATAVAAGPSSSAFVSGGQLYVAGSNTNGQLGLGAGSPAVVANFTAVPNVSGVAAVRLWASLAVVADGVLYTCGANGAGQLGLGDFRPRSTLQRVPMPTTQAVVTVAIGADTMVVRTQPTVTPTSTLTGTRTSSRSTTLTATDSATATASRTATATPVPTLTPSPTATMGLVACNVMQSEPGVSIISSPGPCTFSADIGPGSRWSQLRYFQIRFQELQGQLSSKLLKGCPARTGGCPDCTACRWNYSWATSVGPTYWYTVAAVDRVLVQLQFEPAAPWDRANHRLERAVVDVSTVAEATSELIGTVCAVAAAVILLAGAFGWSLWDWWARTQAAWRSNPKLGLPAVRLAWLGCAGCTGVGVAWSAAVMLTTEVVSRRMDLMAGGVAMAAVGAVASLLLLVYCCWDGVAYQCPICERQVSRWRFIGVYLPATPGSSCHGIAKAHRRHAACVRCGRAVVGDAWRGSKGRRRYHEACWRAHAQAALTDPTYRRLQCLPEQRGELAFLLAEAVSAAAEEAIDFLIQTCPGLHHDLLPSPEGPTATHLAARTSDATLRRLLRHATSNLDPLLVGVQDAGVDSFVIRGLARESNDLYVHHPLLVYNGQPVFVGQTTGRYIYYFEPTVGDKVPYDAGWCVSPHFGSGAAPQRLPLPSYEWASAAPPDAALPCGVPVTTSLPPSPPRDWWPGNLWFLRPRRVSAYAAGEAGGTGDSRSPQPPPQPSRQFQRAPDAPASVPSMSLAELDVRFVPHATSLLEAAVSAGNQAAALSLIQLYKEQYVSCVQWQKFAGHGLWAACPGNATQRASSPRVQPAGSPAEAGDELASGLRCGVQCGDAAAGWAVTADPWAVADWSQAAVLFDSGHLAAAAADPAMFQLLCEQRVVDYSLFAPPAAATRWAVDIASSLHETMFFSALDRDVAASVGTAGRSPVRRVVGSPRQPKTRRANSVAGAGLDCSVSGIGTRLTDGLAAPQSDASTRFFPPDYRSEVGVLRFCYELPQNPLGLRFAPEPLLALAEDALLKVHEVARQWPALSPEHTAAVYVYTYELAYERGEGEGGDQLYQAMNRAMRLPDAAGIAYFRPLIWAIARALAALPPYAGKLYRGIDCRFAVGTYRQGGCVCWPAFSSASRSQRVAEEFAKGAEGSLFFLHSMTARKIDALSRYPEEEEVLFDANTMFRVTSTLQSNSDIGSFYSKIDNVAMEEVADLMAGEGLGVGRILLEVPRDDVAPMLALIRTLPGLDVDGAEFLQDKELGVVARVRGGLLPAAGDAWLAAAMRPPTAESLLLRDFTSATVTSRGSSRPDAAPTPPRRPPSPSRSPGF